jgi:hypothetical protein
MTTIVDQLKNYRKAINGHAFAWTSLLIAVLVLLNYTVGIQSRIILLTGSWQQFLAFFLLFGFVYGAAWLITLVFSGDRIHAAPFFYLLLAGSALIFAGKITFYWLSDTLTRDLPIPWNAYWSNVLNWPCKGLFVLIMVAVLWRAGNYEGPVAGLCARRTRVAPYLLLLLCMVPLIAIAAMQPDFQEAYPKWQWTAFIEPYTTNSLPYKLLFELSYGLDFVTIELFFRGFLVLAFTRYAGKDAILPMAAFYCSIHFGKPVFECITSYFGGIILGVIVYHTRSIWGGLIVHLGIAWLMEVAGYIAQCTKS